MISDIFDFFKKKANAGTYGQQKIDDISKRLGLDNRVILAKAKSLGITTAKAPSSLIDRISAEWIEEELIKEHPEIAAKLPPKPVIAPTPYVSPMKRDPQEDDPKLKPLFDAAGKEAIANLAAKGFHKKIGFCHLFWGEKKEILLEKYGIDWKSPSEMNKNCFFD
jgi:hypothetical protein